MKNYKRFAASLVFLVCLLLGKSLSAEILATCSNPEGHGYYVSNGLIDEKSAGWEKEKITNGTVSLSKTAAGYDILFVDSRKIIVSSVADGAKVMLMSHTKDDAIFLVAYQDMGTIEVYKFFQNSTGQKQYAFTTTRSNIAPITKVSLMVGNCSLINFESIN